MEGQCMYGGAAYSEGSVIPMSDGKNHVCVGSGGGYCHWEVVEIKPAGPNSFRPGRRPVTEVPQAQAPTRRTRRTKVQ
jgi:hypothetical protein